MEIQLKPAIDEDRDFLSKLFYEVRSSEFTPLGLPVPALEQLLAMQHRAQTAGYEAQFPTAIDNVVWNDGKRIGRMLISRDADGIHLIDIALMPQHRGLGIGTSLLARLCEEARANHRSVTLQVRTGSPARHLYERLGFKSVTEDGQYLTMRWKASA